jgi:hypothetical protein
MHNHCIRVKPITVADSVCVFVIIHQAKCMHCITLSPVACLALPFFFTVLCLKLHNLWGKKVIEHKVCMLISSTTFV